MGKIRLSVALARAGVASRRKCEEYIFAGKIRVGSEVVTTPQTKVDPEKDKIFFHKKRVTQADPHFYFLFNKPAGYLCTHTCKGREKNIYDLLPKGPRLFSLGRLDKMTSGLLLVTNDGSFCHKVIHPSANMEKEYHVTLQELVTEEMCEEVKKGVWIERKKVIPKSVKKIAKNILSVTVTEGKKREVRILMEDKGYTITSLKRVRIDFLRLGRLKPGNFRLLSKSEVKQLLERSSIK